jgi:trehalose 6-phosphate phosphatase
LVTVTTEQHPKFDRRRSALLLDIDGTLLDIAPTPEAVMVPSGLVEAIGTISARSAGAVAFVSGRPLAVMDRLFAPLRLAAVGCHGGEIRIAPESEVLRQPLLADLIKQRVMEIARMVAGTLVEDKGQSIAIHFRAVPDAGPRLREALERDSALQGDGELQLLGGKSVIEIKPKWFNKGTGVAQLLQHPPFSSRKPVFIGDDETDKDVIQTLGGFGGTGYGVGRKLPGTAFTFASPGQVRNWLAALARG